jgi:septum site-determining protein MinC
MNKPAAAALEPAFEIRFGQVGLAQMRIRSTDAAAVQAQLTARVAAAPALFERAALCLDLSPLDHDISAADLRAVLEAIRRTGLLPVGLAHGTAAIDALARELDLPVLTQFRAQQSYGAAVSAVKAASQQPTPAPAPVPAPPR